MAKDYLELLKAIGNGIEYHELERKFDHQFDYATFTQQVQARGHAHNSRTPDGKSILKLSPEGWSHIKKESQITKKWYRKAEWWGIIVSGAIGAVGLAVALFRP